MRNHMVTYLMPIVAVMTLGLCTPRADAAELLVFVSAFAAGEEGAIHAYRLDVATGALQLLRRTTEVEYPFFLAFAPDRNFLYSTHAQGEFGGAAHEHVAAFELVGDAGELKLLNRQSTRGSASCYLEVDATGKAVVVANYGTGSVASLPIRPDGSLGEIATFVQHEGTSVDPARQKGPHAHCAVISPDNRFVLAADLGLDRVITYRLDAAAAELAPGRPAFVRTPPGVGPRHLTFHPDGQRVYVINELANSITYFEYDAEPGLLIERQTIPTLPEGFDGTSYCADVKVAPNGRFVYGTNRGHDSIAVYRVAADGQLSLVEIEPSLGRGPQNLAITPGGELLLCANMPGNNLVVFQIDSQSGGLTPVGEPVSMPSPSCIMIR